MKTEFKTKIFALIAEYPILARIKTFEVDDQRMNVLITSCYHFVNSIKSMSYGDIHLYSKLIEMAAEVGLELFSSETANKFFSCLDRKDKDKFRQDKIYLMMQPVNEKFLIIRDDPETATYSYVVTGVAMLPIGHTPGEKVILSEQSLQTSHNYMPDYNDYYVHAHELIAFCFHD